MQIYASMPYNQRLTTQMMSAVLDDQLPPLPPEDLVYMVRTASSTSQLDVINSSSYFSEVPSTLDFHFKLYLESTTKQQSNIIQQTFATMFVKSKEQLQIDYNENRIRFSAIQSNLKDSLFEGSLFGSLKPATESKSNENPPKKQMQNQNKQVFSYNSGVSNAIDSPSSMSYLNKVLFEHYLSGQNINEDDHGIASISASGMLSEDCLKQIELLKNHNISQMENNNNNAITYMNAYYNTEENNSELQHQHSMQTVLSNYSLPYPNFTGPESAAQLMDEKVQPSADPFAMRPIIGSSNLSGVSSAATAQRGPPLCTFCKRNNEPP